jgi:predicted amino acid dehydrogenase
MTDLRKPMEFRWRSRRISSDSSHRPMLLICTASPASPSLLLGGIAPGAIVCDAGYPKNLSPSAEMPGTRVLFGGLG